MLVLQPLSRQTVRKALRLQAGAGGKPVELQPVGCIAYGPAEAPNDGEGAAAGHGLVLPRGQHRAVPRMIKRRVVDIVAHVIFIEPYGAVMGKPQVLRVDKIAGAGFRARVLKLHMPEPGRRRLRKHQAQAKAYTLPCSLSCHALIGYVKARSAARPEKRRRIGRAARLAQIDICRPALHLASGKQVQHDVAAIHAPYRPIGVELKSQARRALDAGRQYG